MKLIEIMKNWVLIALGFAGVVAVAFWGMGMENFAMSQIAIRAGIVTASFAIVLIGGSLLEQKMVKRFQKQLKGGEKNDDSKD